jgi:flavin-binding protein dodecin
MSVAKVIEITATSPESFADAAKQGIARASDTIEDVRGAWIKEQKLVVEKGEITEFRVDMMITFVMHE